MSETIKEKIKKTIEEVEEFEDPFRIEAFKIILKEKITMETSVKTSDIETKKKIKGAKTTTNSNASSSELKQKNPLEKLAKKCNISKEELSDVINIKNEHIEIVKRIKLLEKTKHIKYSIALLTAYRELHEIEWLPTKILKKSLDMSRVGDLKHLFRSISKVPIIVDTGIKKQKSYKITEKGLDEGYEIIKKIAKDEELIPKKDNSKNEDYENN